MTLEKKLSGVLLHPSSLPNSFQCGDLGPAARDFIDFLHNAGQSYWQFLPLNPVGPGNSPYSTTCSLALEDLYISCEDLASENLIPAKKLPNQSKTNKNFSKCHFKKARKEKEPLLKLAFENFQTKPFADLRKNFQNWFTKEKHWLHDFALFEIACEKFKTKNWASWPQEIRERQNIALDKLRNDHKNDYDFICFKQFIINRQAQKLKDYARSKKIEFIGDLPIFVAYESSDVWSKQELFCLDKKGNMTHVAGVPPDPFFADGQRWGNALYNWKNHEKENFAWWISRMERLYSLFDLIRIDHFIGFHHYWEIPAEAPTAKTGKWVKALGKELFTAMQKKFSKLNLIAEDLGSVTQEVFDLRDNFEIPGMRVVQFGFYGDPGSVYHNPSQYPSNCAVYPGTHDNNTIAGWFDDLKKEKKHKQAFESVKVAFGKKGKEVASNILKTALASPATIVITQLQDILFLDGKHRMNVPGTPSGNWTWRFGSKSIGKEKVKELRALTKAFERLR